MHRQYNNKIHPINPFSLPTFSGTLRSHPDTLSAQLTLSSHSGKLCSRQGWRRLCGVRVGRIGEELHHLWQRGADVGAHYADDLRIQVVELTRHIRQSFNTACTAVVIDSLRLQQLAHLLQVLSVPRGYLWIRQV